MIFFPYKNLQSNNKDNTKDIIDMRILVTGVAGYIGSVLVKQLLDKNYRVLGLDSLIFGGESLLAVYNHPHFAFIKQDIRDEGVLEEVIKEVDGVVHLAAIVGDPACAKQPDLAKEVNWSASKYLFDICTENKNVERFIFASTCSNYGKMEGETYVNETSPLRPVSLYAELKVKFEHYILEKKTNNNLSPTSLRFSTVYGLSPRMRFDLTVNEFIREVTLGRELKIFGEQFWRPYCHVEDLARSVVHVLEMPADRVANNVFGVGDTEENYQKKMIADEILKIVPNCSIQYIKKDQDPRDFRVDFSKIKTELGYSITRRVRDGLREIHNAIKNNIIVDPDHQKYINV
jgi:nucleoside-diphosphate-sugar epimerase